MTNPTPEETIRAAEIAPEIARIAGLPFAEGRIGVAHPEHRGFLSYWSPLDPTALAAVVAALPPEVVEAAYWHRIRDWWPYGERPSLLQWFLTPSGTLAFYEAVLVVTQEDTNGD